MSPSLARTLIDVVQVSQQHARDAAIWREISQAAIHQLAQQRRNYRLLQERHERLIEDYRALRQMRMEQAA